MRNAPIRPEPAAPAEVQAKLRALAAAIAWMLTAQLACVALWDADWLTRQGAVVHWLLVGVLPPALALWTARPKAARAGP